VNASLPLFLQSARRVGILIAATKRFWPNQEMHNRMRIAVFRVRRYCYVFSRRTAALNGKETRGLLWANNKARHKPSDKASEFYMLGMQINFDINGSRTPEILAKLFART
jgi:hypothetical protein